MVYGLHRSYSLAQRRQVLTPQHLSMLMDCDFSRVSGGDFMVWLDVIATCFSCETFVILYICDTLIRKSCSEKKMLCTIVLKTNLLKNYLFFINVIFQWPGLSLFIFFLYLLIVMPLFWLRGTRQFFRNMKRKQLYLKDHIIS